MAVELATAYVTLIPSARGIAGAIRAALGGAEVESEAAKAGAKASSAFSGGFAKISGLLAAAGIAEGFKAAIEGASSFQSATELLVTAGGEAQTALASVRNGIKAIAVETGTSTGQLAEGMYTLEKAGIRGANGLGVLRVAAEGARAENVDLGVMTNALTSIMRSYNLPASAATQVTNQLVAASGAAKTTMGEFAGSLSTVLPVASAAGLSFAQVGGAIAALTGHGTSAQEATQELASTIRSLQAPNAVAVSEMAQLGLNAVFVSKNLGRYGLTGTLAQLTDAITSHMGPAGLVVQSAFNQSAGAAQDMQIEISKMPPAMQALAKQFEGGQLTMSQWRKVARGLPADQRLMMQGFMSTYTQAHKFNDLLTSGSPAAQTYAAALEKMLGGATGLNTALMLTGGNMAAFAGNVRVVAAAGRQGGRDISTWAETQKNFNVQMGRLKEVAQTTAITVGSALLPRLTQMGSWIADHVGAVKVAGTVTLGLATAMLAATAAAKLASAAEGVYNVVTGEATAKTGLQVIALGVQRVAMLAASVAAKAFAAAQWVLNAALDGNPLVLIVAGLAALVTGLVLAYEHSETFRRAVEAVWKAIQLAAKDIAGAFVAAWHGIVTAFNAVTSFLKQWGPTILAVFVPIIGLPLLIWQHWSQIVGLLSQVWSAISSAVVNFFTALPGRVLATLAALPNALATFMGDAIGYMIVALLTAAVLFFKFWTELVPTVLSDIAKLPGLLANLGAQALTDMASGVSTGAQAVWAIFASVIPKAAGILASLPGRLAGIGAAALSAMAAAMVAAAGSVWGFVTGMPTTIVRLLGDLGKLLYNAGSATLTGFSHGVSDGFAGVWWFVNNMPGKILTAFVNVGKWLYGAGQALIQGFINGIESMAGALINAIESTITNHLPGFVKKALGINSPSRVFAEIGRHVMEGLAAGIADGASLSTSALSDAVAGLTGSVNAGQLSIAAGATVPAFAGSAGRGAPVVGSMTVTAYNPAEAAAKTAAEIGWLQLTRGQ